MKSLAERTQEAIDAGFTVGALAAAAGKSSSAVSQWLSGTTKSIKADSAIGLQKLTGWSWTWWATGMGERGDTKRADEPERCSLAGALDALGHALAVEMPDDVRQDAADLLAKMALRHGAARHRQELAALLSSAAVLPLANRALDHSASHPTEQDSPDAPLERGERNTVRAEWDERFKRSAQPKSGSSPGVTTNMRGVKPPKEKRG